MASSSVRVPRDSGISRKSRSQTSKFSRHNGIVYASRYFSRRKASVTPAPAIQAGDLVEWFDGNARSAVENDLPDRLRLSTVTQLGRSGVSVPLRPGVPSSILLDRQTKTQSVFPPRWRLHPKP